MFDTIVWATDGSEFADSTLPIVTELAGIHRSKIVALHINEHFRGGRFGGGPILADEDDLQRKIALQVADLKAAGFDTEVEVIVSGRHDTAALIAEAAERAHADLIVVGTHGRSEAGTLLHGSVAKGLAHVARCPVLVMPPLHAEAPAAVAEQHVGASV